MESWEAGLKRYMDVLRQMEHRAGPVYEVAKKRSRIVGGAWREAGGPRAVSRVTTADGQVYRFRGRGNSRWCEPATENDWNAWLAWKRERERLRGALQG